MVTATKVWTRLLVGALGVAAVALVAAAPPPARGRAGVAADHELASAAGAEMLRLGGNAVDAAVAAALAAGVVQPAGSGLGGGGFAVMVLPDGTRRTLDFREVAPAAARRDLFLAADGKVIPGASASGGKAIGVPGEPRGLKSLLAEHGRLSPKVVARPALRLATEGWHPGTWLVESLAKSKYPAIHALFDVGGRAPTEGDTLRNPGLARALAAWSSSDALSTGPQAQAIVDAAREAGGVLTREDLAAYTPVERAPLVGKWKDWTVVTMAPPSSGGVILLQALSVLDGYDLAGLGQNSADYVHLVTEVLKHGYADRADVLGDPGFVDVPIDRLLSGDRIEAIRRGVWPGRTFPPAHYGGPALVPADHGTQHISAYDAEGGACALTTTVNLPFGSGVVVPSLGMILNDQMDDFATAPGVPNQFGLVGAEANAVAPGKRPLSSMSPTILLGPDGKVDLVVGGSGGSFIISAVVQVILDITVFGMDPSEAVAAPRFHHQWLPDELVLEQGFGDETVSALAARGHKIRRNEGFSSVQVIRVRDDGTLDAASDPRKGGWPVGVW